MPDANGNFKLSIVVPELPWLKVPASPHNDHERHLQAHADFLAQAQNPEGKDTSPSDSEA